MRKLKLAALWLAIGCSILGCSPAARDQYDSAGKSASQATKEAGKALATDAANAKIAADNALESAKVRNSLQAAAGLDTKAIHVDTDTTTPDDHTERFRT